MSRIFKWALIIIGVLFVLALIGSLVTPEGREGLQDGAGLAASATPEPIVEATPTLTPTPTSTPTATPSPTPEPTPTPTPEPTLNAGQAEWLAYSVARLAFIQDEFLPAINAWDTSGSNPFVSAMNAIDVWTALLGEQTDLTFVEPHPCFADWHNEWVRTIDTLYEGYDKLTDGGIQSDLLLIEEALGIIDEGTAMQEALTARLSDVTAACGG